MNSEIVEQIKNLSIVINNLASINDSNITLSERSDLADLRIKLVKDIQWAYTQIFKS